MAVSLNEWAGDHVAVQCTAGREVSADEPIHHGFVGAAELLIVTDGCVEEVPADLLSAQGEMEQVPAHHLADALVRTVSVIARKSGRIEVGFAVDPGSIGPARSAALEFNHSPNRRKACLGSL